MFYFDSDQQKKRARFHRVKQWGFAFIIGFFLVIASSVYAYYHADVYWWYHLTEPLFESKLTWVGLLAGLALFWFKCWRCPNCNHLFSHEGSPKFCKECQFQLVDYPKAKEKNLFVVGAEPKKLKRFHQARALLANPWFQGTALLLVCFKYGHKLVKHVIPQSTFANVGVWAQPLQPYVPLLSTFGAVLLIAVVLLFFIVIYMAWRCPACNAVVDIGGLFCERCGTKFDTL